MEEIMQTPKYCHHHSLFSLLALHTIILSFFLEFIELNVGFDILRGGLRLSWAVLSLVLPLTPTSQ